MWWGWGSYSSRRGRGQWRASWDVNATPLEQQDETRIEPGMSEPEIETRIRRRIEKRRKEQAGFISHVVSFVAVNALLWGIWLFGMIADRGNSVGFPWPAFVTFFWGIGLVSHATQVYQNSASAMARREQAMRYEVELEKARLGLGSDALDSEYADNKRKRTEKAKRDPSVHEDWVRLSDDGELVPVDGEEHSDGSQHTVGRASHS